MARYGRLVIQKGPEGDLQLHSNEPAVLVETTRQRRVNDLLLDRIDPNTWRIADWARGQIKQELLKLGLKGKLSGLPFSLGVYEDEQAINSDQ